MSSRFWRSLVDWWLGTAPREEWAEVMSELIENDVKAQRTTTRVRCGDLSPSGRFQCRLPEHTGWVHLDADAGITWDRTLGATEETRANVSPTPPKGELRCVRQHPVFLEGCVLPLGHAESHVSKAHRIWPRDYSDPGVVAGDDPKPTPEPTPEPAGELTDWWMARAMDEVTRTVPKAVEYGSTDLRDLGHQLARVAGRTVSDEEAAEWGIYFYILGKFGRWSDALVRGDRVSADTLFDIGVYVRMAQRVRSHGGWPGNTEEHNTNGN